MNTTSRLNATEAQRLGAAFSEPARKARLLLETDNLFDVNYIVYRRVDGKAQLSFLGNENQGTAVRGGSELDDPAINFTEVENDLHSVEYALNQLKNWDRVVISARTSSDGVQRPDDGIWMSATMTPYGPVTSIHPSDFFRDGYDADGYDEFGYDEEGRNEDGETREDF